MALADLLENGGLAGARRGDDQTARAFADRRHHVNDPRLDEVGLVSSLNFSIGSMVVRFSNRTDLV